MAFLEDLARAINPGAFTGQDILSSSQQILPLLETQRAPFQEGLVRPGIIPEGPENRLIRTLLASKSPEFASRGLEQLIQGTQQHAGAQRLADIFSQRQGLRSQLEGVAQGNFPGLSGTALTQLRAMDASPKKQYTEVKVDDFGNWKGINVDTKRVETIPGEKLSKLFQVSGVGPGGQQITELVQPSTLGIQDGRITISQGIDPATSRQAKDKLSTLSIMEDALNDYRSTVERTGAKIIPGLSTVELNTKYTDLVLQAKELANLGALAGPDLDLINDLIIDPTSIKGNIIDAFGGKEALLKNIDQIEKIIRRNVNAQRRRLGQKPIEPKKEDRPPLSSFEKP